MIDSNIFEQIALKGMLDQYQIGADQVKNGLEALQMMQALIVNGEPVYKLILVDEKLPSLKGCQTAVLIRDFLRENAPD